MDNEVKQRNRRRKRAQRMQAQRQESKAKDGDSGEDESPVREKPQRPPNRRKKSREPLVEEDIVDGFAILGFKTYEDLEVSARHFLCSSRHQVSADGGRRHSCCRMIAHRRRSTRLANLTYALISLLILCTKNTKLKPSF